MEFSAETIRLFRLHSHHLDRKLPFESILEAAGACGLQNSPPGCCHKNRELLRGWREMETEVPEQDGAEKMQSGKEVER